MNRNKTILVIDDDKNFSLGLATVLQRAGFAVQAAMNAQEGLAAMRASRPDLILCDVMMPSVNGIQLKKEISNDPDLGQIPFLFLTARTSQADKLAGLGSGADDYITKPVDSGELLARIHAVLRRDQISRQRGIKEAKSDARRLYVENQELKRNNGDQADPLTGAVSRHALETFNPTNFRFIAIVDLDHFKHINDKYGRAFGDQVLTEFVVFCQRAVRPGDVVIRWGSDEFLLLLDILTKSQDGYQDVVNILARIQQQYFNTYPRLSITFSYGIAMMQSSFDETIEQADFRMREMKRYHKPHTS